ncbi:hypothetical protein [Bacillus paramycoides]|uniref:hypothetical protein n=1 Tax=Bacillus paramycoides TaxID=2026194 RepID=UPI002E200C9B|nr:hypothetical protein [Bacillus paramycoides]MED1464838.1 hypothetical protein [Bacillus paramycoides]MED1493365.1 hypothetical protein [Bacillus paramycoides]
MVTVKQAKEVLTREGYKTDSPAQQQSRKNYAIKKSEMSEKRFAMQDVTNYETIRDQLTQGQKGVLLLLTTAMRVKKGGQLYKGQFERLTVEDVSNMIGKKAKQTFTILTELENLGAITKEKSGKHVYVNIVEGFYLCGFMEEKRPMVKIFKKRLQEVAGLLSLNEMGFLADVLSHIHWTTHILCSNPTEPDVSKLEVWRAKDIVELLGYSRNFVSATLRKFKRNGITMEIGTIIDVICLDPELVSRSAKEVTLLDIKEVARKIHLSSSNYRNANKK